MNRISKRMKAAALVFDQQKVYSLEQAVDQLADFPKVKFDETVELHFSLMVDPKASDQVVRGTVILPHGSGKKTRIAVFCKGELEQKAQKAGADVVGAQDLIEKVAQGFLDFDVVIASPDVMRDLSRLGKVLGPRGLMPTPKAGTVTMDIERAIKEVKSGKIEFKTDKQAGIHVGIGKRSFPKEHLVENARSLIDAITQLKPSAVKGNLIKRLFLSTTMGPGLRIAI